MKRLPPKGQALTKSDEIRFLGGLHEEFAERDSYLKSLFTVELVRWAVNHIQNDTPPDILSWLQETRDVASTDAQKHRLDKQELEQRLRKAEAAILRQGEIERNLQTQVADGISRVEQTMNKLYGAQDRLAAERGVSAELNAVALSRSLEILELKAQLFDFMVEQDDREGLHPQ